MRFPSLIFVLATLCTGLSTAQQPVTPPQRQIRTGTRVLNPALRQRPAAQPRSAATPARRVPGAPRPVPSLPAATPAPSPAPAPVSMQPMRPADMPPVPPQVTYRDGMLTVQALNSTMGSLLQVIRNKTGIQFEGAENSNERVAINAGPAPEGEVLSAIFNGSGFDYVVMDRPDSPGTVQRVILTRHGGTGAPGATVAAAPQPQQSQEAQPQENEEDVPDDQVSADPEQPQDVPAEPPAVQPPPTAENQQTAPKTPEQLLQELKEMQQQQQQNQQPANPGQVPRKPPQ